MFLGERRTTVSLDAVITFFLELKLGEKPSTPEAKRAVNQWLQERLDESGDSERVLVSHWLKREALLFLVNPELIKRCWRWVDEAENENG